ncbi:MAG TPA: hypothetical protein VFV72_16350 [Candidatus Limnocylindrales bacterium]|nr:hypothetical protein [Candidatus Limnocylindrales bacterium]
MARAKRTNRAEARRNYRAAMATSADELEDAELDDEGIPDAAADKRKAQAAAQPKTATSPATPPGARPSISNAFRSAFRPLDLPGDLRALPRLLIDKAFLIPAALIVIVAIAVIVFQGRELISRELSAFVLAPPPLAPVFIAGFLAPRASWLLGGLLGVVQTLAVLAVISTPSLAELTSVPDAATLASSVLISVVFGAFYAAAMAWYKRFLRAANPPRNAPAATRPAGKPKRGSEGRPMLAKRR